MGITLVGSLLCDPRSYCDFSSLVLVLMDLIVTLTNHEIKSLSI